jgi:hypothetical protein
MQSIHLQSEAFEAFSSDFALMKKSLLHVTHKLGLQNDRIQSLEDEMDGVRTENLKLVTDMKIIRNEYQEVLNSMFTLEKRNANLGAENEALKRLLGHGGAEVLYRDEYSSLQPRANISLDDRKPLAGH